MNFTKLIAPFSWIEHDDKSASVTLYTSVKYKKELFKTRKRERFTGSGYRKQGDGSKGKQGDGSEKQGDGSSALKIPDNVG